MLPSLARYQLQIFLLLIAAYSTAASALPDSRPAVAIRTPIVEDSVKSSSYLDLSILREEMEAALRATRKFRVLTRDKTMLNAVIDEQEFAKSSRTLGDAAASGKIRNAHYIIQPVVQDFVMYRSHRKIPVLDGKFKRQDAGRIRVAAQMLDSQSGEIVTTFTLKSRFATPEIVVNQRGGGPARSHFVAMAKKLGAQLANQVINQVFPMKVVKRTPKMVLINRGEDGGLHKGERLAVYSVGEALIDPDTGESLGAAEEYAGEVVVDRILPKLTYARIVKEETRIERGDILRMLKGGK